MKIAKRRSSSCLHESLYWLDFPLRRCHAACCYLPCNTEAHVRKLCDIGRLSKALKVVLATQLHGYTVSLNAIRHLLKSFKCK
ncbi:hypothetical protein GOP47_0016895 [Adiantum capillus-veneris]|uniref:Uncharacterized protein n=1 Tax=Adiantum capillus-veneris TaxID=13818 RepID=A0A9D4UIN2_ADICA|nr:hypothetical protein GOP47_0016895 [Adiantum capillus-veneris]